MLKKLLAFSGVFFINSFSPTLGGSLCLGSFSDMSTDNASGDPSGLTVTVRSSKNVMVTIFEGSVSEIEARNIAISDQRISFDYLERSHLSGMCKPEGIIAPGFNGYTGKMEANHLLRRLKSK